MGAGRENKLIATSSWAMKKILSRILKWKPASKALTATPPPVAAHEVALKHATTRRHSLGDGEATKVAAKPEAAGRPAPEGAPDRKMGARKKRQIDRGHPAADAFLGRGDKKVTRNANEAGEGRTPAGRAASGVGKAKTARPPKGSFL